jgi:hypothetical protein
MRVIAVIGDPRVAKQILRHGKSGRAKNHILISLIS